MLNSLRERPVLLPNLVPVLCQCRHIETLEIYSRPSYPGGMPSSSKTHSGCQKTTDRTKPYIHDVFFLYIHTYVCGLLSLLLSNI